MFSLQNILLNNEFKITACPHCNSSHFIKFGRYKDEPRFKCKNCNRTFCKRTKTPWYYSKKSTEHWITFCLLLMECKSLKHCAKALNINIATAFYWRHKLLTALKTITEPHILSDYVTMQHYFITESFKGTKNHLPQTHPRKKLWIIMSYDTCDNSLLTPYCKNKWDKTNFENLVYSKVHPSSYISVYGNRLVQVYANKHNKKLKKTTPSQDKSKCYKLINIFRSILAKTRGIATKYLLEYFALVKVHFLEQNFNLNHVFHNINDGCYIKSRAIKNLSCL